MTETFSGAVEEEIEAAADAIEETEETEEDFASKLAAAREKWADMNENADPGYDESDEDAAYEEIGAEAEEPETAEEFVDEADEADETESEPEGPIVPEYLQQQAISAEERARRAAAKAAAAKSAPKPAKQADTSIDDFTKKLKQLKVAYENDLITEEEYNEAKKHLLELL